jgi:DNA-binding CsgD family transcriptional regulator
MIEAPVDLELQIEARRALAAVGDLRPRQRRYLALFAAGYTYDEIAELSGATYTNVNKHLTRARAGVRELQAVV